MLDYQSIKRELAKLGGRFEKIEDETKRGKLQDVGENAEEMEEILD